MRGIEKMAKTVHKAIFTIFVVQFLPMAINTDFKTLGGCAPSPSLSQYDLVQNKEQKRCVKYDLKLSVYEGIMDRKLHKEKKNVFSEDILLCCKI